MLIAGIVAEYNPFHKGHQALLQYCRETGCSHLVAVMSGNFVQRGEPAILDKHARAEMAVRNGIDLVIELPVYWALSSAENFAFGAVSLLQNAGCQRLYFGSECGDAALLQKAAALLLDPNFINAVKKQLKSGNSFASVRNQIWSESFNGDTAQLLQSPNNILGIEYCKALIRLNSSLQPCTMQRLGPGHHENTPQEGIASGTLLRKMITTGKHWENYLPAGSIEVLQRELRNSHAPADTKRLEVAVLSALRKMSSADFAQLPDISEGLENRLFQSAQAATSLENLYMLVKSKRYTLARIRRLVLCAFLNIKALPSFSSPPYLRVLAMNSRGSELLREIKKQKKIPILTRASQFESLPSFAKTIWQQEQQSCNLYNLSLPNPLPCGTDLTHKLTYIP